MQHADANIVLRYLMGDDKTQSPQAKELLATGAVHLSIEVLAEVIYVLQGSYGTSRKEIGGSLFEALRVSGIQINDEVVVERGIDLFGTTTLDFVDCILAARAQVEGAQIHTFDKEIQKLLGQIENEFDLSELEEAMRTSDGEFVSFDEV
jgi:predicted nucleic-acid-binding protein